MTIRILDDADEGHLEKPGAYLAGVFRNNGIYFTDKEGAALLKDILATIPAVDDAAVKRAVEAVDEAAYFVIEFDQDPEIENTEDCVRAAIAALGKGDK